MTMDAKANEAAEATSGAPVPSQDPMQAAQPGVQAAEESKI